MPSSVALVNDASPASASAPPRIGVSSSTGGATTTGAGVAFLTMFDIMNKLTTANTPIAISLAYRLTPATLVLPELGAAATAIAAIADCDGSAYSSTDNALSESSPTQFFTSVRILASSITPAASIAASSGSVDELLVFKMLTIWLRGTRTVADRTFALPAGVSICFFVPLGNTWDLLVVSSLDETVAPPPPPPPPLI